MSADNLPRRLLRFVRRNRRRNADWWADEWCREATERDALQRRIDAVREWCDEQLEAREYIRSVSGGVASPESNAASAAMESAAITISALLDGEAGE